MPESTAIVGLMSRYGAVLSAAGAMMASQGSAGTEAIYSLLFSQIPEHSAAESRQCWVSDTNQRLTWAAANVPSVEPFRFVLCKRQTGCT